MIAFELENLKIVGLNPEKRSMVGARGVTMAALRRQRFAVQARIKRIRAASCWALLGRSPRQALRAVIASSERLVISITRVGPGVLDDDNLIGGLKPVRDGIADAVELPDHDPRLRWLYRQERAGRGTYSVRVTLEPMTKAQLVARVAELEEARP